VSSQFKNDSFAFGQNTAFFPSADGRAMDPDGCRKLLLGEMAAFAKAFE
jgi:hypothetical protein